MAPCTKISFADRTEALLAQAGPTDGWAKQLPRNLDVSDVGVQISRQQGITSA